MVLRGRSFNCWCKEHKRKLAEIERQKKLEEINQQKKKAILAMAKKLNNKITSKKSPARPNVIIVGETRKKSVSPTTGKSRWGP